MQSSHTRGSVGSSCNWMVVGPSSSSNKLAFELGNLHNCRASIFFRRAREPDTYFTAHYSDILTPGVYLRPEAFVRCQAGSLSRVEYIIGASEAAAREPTFALRAIVRGIPEFLPPGGMLLGRWIAEDTSLRFAIRLLHRRLLFVKDGGASTLFSFNWSSAGT